jgi:poly(3-hydroxybutyrate) depolymerase
MKYVGYIFALNLCWISPVLAAPPPLPAYGVDIHQTSVSGVSSGGAMAVQMHVAHSSIMRGVGVIAGVAYGCTGPEFSFSVRVAQLLNCMEGVPPFGGSAGADAAIQRTNDAAAIPNHKAIDALAKLKDQKVWLFSGYNDGSVRRAAMDAVAKYYEHYVDRGNVFYQTDNHAPHGLITDGRGIDCLDFRAPYINDCKYDAAGHLLQHIYGRLNPPGTASTSSLKTFDQTEFVDPALVGKVGLSDTGYVYIPAACTPTTRCRVHVVFHGCKQYAGNPEVLDAVPKKGGYNEWAETNNIIVLYPQTEAIQVDVGWPLVRIEVNSGGCWDWWGLDSSLPGNGEFARKDGYQISAIRKMLDWLAASPGSGGGSSDSFGTPQFVSVADKTSTSLALIWQPNSAATGGFNIYRSRSLTGKYKKINKSKVSGASFADRGRARNTTYYYKVSAIDGSNNESARSDAAHEKTAGKPPACDPYSSNNPIHILRVRALPDVLGHARAIDSTKLAGIGDDLGPDNMDTYQHLTKDTGPLPSYHLRYCP